jgi:alkylation response protein AidB-like acyl-CoA dehydrogenase
VSLRAYRTIDELRAADIRFDNVMVSDEARIGTDCRALPLIEDCVDYSTALTCAEAMGALEYANDATLEYVKTRKHPGCHRTFQALQHRLVDMFIAGEQAAPWPCLRARSWTTSRTRRFTGVVCQRRRSGSPMHAVTQARRQFNFTAAWAWPTR